MLCRAGGYVASRFDGILLLHLMSVWMKPDADCFCSIKCLMSARSVPLRYGTESCLNWVSIEDRDEWLKYEMVLAAILKKFVVYKIAIIHTWFSRLMRASVLQDLRVSVVFLFLYAIIMPFWWFSSADDYFYAVVQHVTCKHFRVPFWSFDDANWTYEG